MMSLPWQSWRDVLNTALVLAVKAGISRGDLHTAVDDAYDDLAPDNIIPITTGLHERTAAIFRFFVTSYHQHGEPPSMAEIREGCKVSSIPLVRYHLAALAKRGLLLHRRRRPAYTLPPQFIRSGRWTGTL